MQSLSLRLYQTHKNDAYAQINDHQEDLDSNCMKLASVRWWIL